MPMEDYDKYDNVDMNRPKGIEFEDESPMGQATQLLGPIKKFLPHIIALAIIIAVALFAYDYFVGSMIQVTITIKDTEGKYLNDSSIKVYAEGANEPVFSESDSATFDLTLRAGSYRYEINAPGYDIQKNYFDVSDEEKEVNLTISKDIDVEITNFEQSFPTRLFVGGTAQFTVKIKNHSSSPANLELVAEKDIEGLVETGKVTIQGNSTQDIQLEITIPSGTTVKDDRDGDDLEAVIRVKNTNKKGEADFILYPNPTEEISLDTAELSANAIENENKDEEEIRIRNRNNFPIEDLTITIEITSATKNDPSEVEKWFQFSEIAAEQNPREIHISTIPAKEDVKKELQVIIPLTAKKELDIKGNIVLDAPFLSEPLKRTLTLDVKEQAEYGIEISLSPGNPIEIEWNPDQSRYYEETANLKVKNTGHLDLHNIVFSIANNTICGIDWLILVENSIDTLRTGETQELKLRTSAPIAIRGQEIPKYCNMHYRYDNPIITGTYIEDTLISFIEIVPKP